MNQPKQLIIYHAACADGFGAAWSAWKKFGDAAEYFPAHHGSEAPDVTGRIVSIVDFSYKRSVLVRMHAQAESLIVLDHHKSAEEDLKGLDFAHFDLDSSGAMLAWRHWHSEVEVPELIAYVQDKDLWNWDLDQSKEVNAALASYPMDFEVWSSLDVDQLREEGAAILRYQTQLVIEISTHVGRQQIAGHDVPCVNAPILQSFVGNHLAAGEAFAAIWFEREDGVRRYSLRSSPPHGIDVAEIAARFGGGGHPSASGFALLPGQDLNPSD